MRFFYLGIETGIPIKLCLSIAADHKTFNLLVEKQQNCLTSARLV